MEYRLHLFQHLIPLLKQRRHTRIVQNHFFSAPVRFFKNPKPLPRYLILFLRGFQDLIHFRRTKSQNLLLPIGSRLLPRRRCQRLYISLPHVLRLHDHNICMKHSRHSTEMCHSFHSFFILRINLPQHKVGDIDQFVRIPLQILRIKLRRNTRDIIVFIIRIVNKNHIWSAFFKIILSEIRNTNIIRILVPFIMHLSETTVAILVIVRNRNDIRITVRILVRSLPHTFQRIPHRGFIWQEHNLHAFWDIMLHTVLHLNQQLTQCLTHLIHMHRGILGNLIINLIRQFTIIFNQRNRNKILAFYRLNNPAQLNGALLTLRQQVQRRSVIMRLYSLPNPIMRPPQQFKEIFCLLFLRFRHIASSSSHLLIHTQGHTVIHALRAGGLRPLRYTLYISANSIISLINKKSEAGHRPSASYQLRFLIRFYF